ncbi:gliding motility-associated peptidyl-prolyl isomerase GldI [Nonlabens sp. SY33080]|uniref:gliding motility-associated peptidyl-prolyl isomerase GldI n=1 Tax=Nonlabens sp. SY33080 TaxID=2719911 RepID=UPI001428C676|nr:gliding motility-associated peptidyl-prolyl isomerase GldI [Nonlabens sp. SY33080]
MKKNWYILLFSLISLTLSSCFNETIPRKAKTKSSSSYLKSSIERNKELAEQEEMLIEKAIKNNADSMLRSQNGFYYRLFKKSENNAPTPKFGDKVTFEYNVLALNGDTIYSTQELSPITKSLEQEYGVFTGMREALKLMQKGDSMIAYFPSYTAYGYYGDDNKIGTNIPFKSHIKLIDVNDSNNKIEFQIPNN